MRFKTKVLRRLEQENRQIEAKYSMEEIKKESINETDKQNRQAGRQLKEICQQLHHGLISKLIFSPHRSESLIADNKDSRVNSNNSSTVRARVSARADLVPTCNLTHLACQQALATMMGMREGGICGKQTQSGPSAGLRVDYRSKGDDNKTCIMENHVREEMINFHR